MSITKGTRFYHRRVLDVEAYDGITPQLCQVTVVRHGSVYYAVVYRYGSREELGTSRSYFPVEQWERWTLSNTEAQKRIAEGEQRQARRAAEVLSEA